jgi:hypothetical protein
VGDGVVAAETGGDDLLLGGSRQEVAGDLLDEKLVERLVVVEGLDHPIAPDPLMPTAIDRVAVGVRVARGIEPGYGEIFPETGRGEQAVHEAVVGIRCGIGDEGLDFLGRWRESGEVEREAADQRAAVGFGGK